MLTVSGQIESGSIDSRGHIYVHTLSLYRAALDVSIEAAPLLNQTTAPGFALAETLGTLGLTMSRDVQQPRLIVSGKAETAFNNRDVLLTGVDSIVKQVVELSPAYLRTETKSDVEARYRTYLSGLRENLLNPTLSRVHLAFLVGGLVATFDAETSDAGVLVHYHDKTPWKASAAERVRYGTSIPKRMTARQREQRARNLAQSLPRRDVLASVTTLEVSVPASRSRRLAKAV